MTATLCLATSYLYAYREKQYNRFIGSHSVPVVHEIGSSSQITSKCYAETSLTNNVHLGILMLIIFHEFVIYPLYQHCTCTGCVMRMKSLWKILIGIAIQIVHITTMIVFDIISGHKFLNNEYNSTIWCIFQEHHGILSQTLNIQWLAIPEYLHFISLTFILTGIIDSEFICSQVPYSMKGIMMGAQYTLVTICSVPIVGVFVVLLEKDLSILGERTISCAFWYALLMIAAYPFLHIPFCCPMNTSLTKGITLNEHYNDNASNGLNY